jgi:hypothetical protein
MKKENAMSTSLAKKEAPGPLTVPEFLKNVHGDEGFGAVEREDLVLPRLGFCQALTPQKKKGKTGYIEDLADGDLFNSVSGEIYEQPLQVIPLLFAKSRIYFRNIKEGGGIICQSFNGIDGGVLCKTCHECPNSQWDAKGNAPACGKFMNFPAVLLPAKEIVVVSLKSTALKVARNWISRMKMPPLAGRPMYSGVFEIKLIESSNQKGDFFAPEITFKRFPTQDEFAFAKSAYEEMKDRAIRADETGLDNEERTEGVIDDDQQPIPF